MRVTGAAPPDITLGIGRFRLYQGEGLARASPRHVDLDPGRFLEPARHQLAPVLLRRAVVIQLLCRNRLRGQAGGEDHRRRHQSKSCNFFLPVYALMDRRPTPDARPP